MVSRPGARGPDFSGTVEHLADVDAAPDEFFDCDKDV
jgi:hypothetical protein